MKRLVIPFILLAALASWAANPHLAVVARKNAGGVSDCLSGTYLGAYNGDHSSGVNVICINDGASSQVGTAQVATVTTEYVEYSSENDYLEWVVVGGDMVDTNACTVYFSIYIPDPGDSSIGNIGLMEAYADSSNVIYTAVSGASDIVGVYYSTSTGSGTDSSFGPSGVVVDTWYRIGISWQVGVAGNDLACSVDAVGDGPTWAEDDDDITALTSDVGLLAIGEHNGGWSVSQTVRVKDMATVTGYKAADPFYP